MLFYTDKNCTIYALAKSALTVHMVQLLVRGKLVFTGVTVSECCMRTVIKRTVHEI